MLIFLAADQATLSLLENQICVYLAWKSIEDEREDLNLDQSQIREAEKSRKLLYDADFRRPTAIVMGAEDKGISKEVLKLCDEQLAIPLIGHIESLNVAAAAAIMLFEVVRQRIGD